MAGIAVIKALVDSTLTTNGNNEITAALHNALVKAIIDTVPNKQDENHYFLREYNASKAYITGMTCIESDLIYKANKATTGAFVGADWDEVSLGAASANGVFDVVNDGGTIPSNFNINLTGRLGFETDLFIISKLQGCVNVGVPIADLKPFSGTYEGLRVGQSLSLVGRNNSAFSEVVNNGYNNGGWRRNKDGFSQKIAFDDLGGIKFYTSTTGLEGAIIANTRLFEFYQNGDAILGKSSGAANGRFHVYSSGSGTKNVIHTESSLGDVFSVKENGLATFIKIGINTSPAAGVSFGVVGDSRLDGNISQNSGTIADNDATPDVEGYNTLVYLGTSNSVVITDLDNAIVGSCYTIIGISDTYTATINSGSNFALNSGASIVLGANDIIEFYCIAPSTFLEKTRSSNI